MILLHPCMYIHRFILSKIVSNAHTLLYSIIENLFTIATIAGVLWLGGGCNIYWEITFFTQYRLSLVHWKKTAPAARLS